MISIFIKPTNLVHLCSSNLVDLLMQWVKERKHWSFVSTFEQVVQETITQDDLTTENTNIDLSENNSGIYFVQIQTASGDIATKKLILRK